MRCSWCGAEQPDGLLMHLTHHPDRPTVCVDERGCSNREMAQYRRRVATAEERLAVKTKGPEHTAVVEQNGAPEPHQPHSSTIRQEIQLFTGRSHILSAADAARQAVTEIDRAVDMADRAIESLRLALTAAEGLGIDTTPVEDAWSDAQALGDALRTSWRQAQELDAQMVELAGQAHQSARLEVA